MNDLYIYHLEIENKQLKEDIETFKFTIITQQQMIDELIGKLDKAKELIKEYKYTKVDNYNKIIEFYKKIDEILGNKENE